MLMCSNETMNGLVRFLGYTLVRSEPNNILRGLVSSRYFSRTNTNFNDFYDLLDVPRNASQADIKNAYYKLSMLHHPDRNRNSERANKKFRSLTNAYEVLGNPRLRRAYDDGLQNASFSQDYQPTKEDLHEMQPEVEDDPQTKFYKQHMRRSQQPGTYYRNQQYNYDEWSKVHYSKLFQQRQKEKQRDENRRNDEQAEKETGSTIVGLLIIVGIVGTGVSQVILNSMDTNKRRPST